MKSITKRISRALQKEFIEGTVYRVDLDRVDVAPSGSTGILRGLPLTGDRDKVKPGDPVKVLTVAGERVALAGDVALDSFTENLVADASLIQLDEKLQLAAGRSSTDSTNAITLNGLHPAESGGDAHIVQTSDAGGIVATGSVTGYGGITIDGGAALNGSIVLTGNPTTINGNLTVNGAISAPSDLRVGMTNNAIDGGGQVLTAGDKLTFQWPFAVTNQSVDLLADVSGSITATISKTTYASYPTWTTVGGIAISSSSKNTYGLGLEWSPAAGDIWKISVSSITSITRLTIAWHWIRR